MGAFRKQGRGHSAWIGKNPVNGRILPENAEGVPKPPFRAPPSRFR